jgi:hypothetical protein
MLIAALLVPAAAVSAQTAYLDAASLAGSAVVSAFHPRAGVVLPIGGRFSLGAEADAYYSAGSGERFLQADILCLARYRPLAGNAYLGAGLGFGAYGLMDAEGQTANYHDPVFAVLFMAEFGLPLRLGDSRLSLEPFLRGYAAAGREFRTGAEAGFRIGWIFGAQGEKSK